MFFWLSFNGISTQIVWSWWFISAIVSCNLDVMIGREIVTRNLYSRCWHLTNFVIVFVLVVVAARNTDLILSFWELIWNISQYCMIMWVSEYYSWPAVEVRGVVPLTVRGGQTSVKVKKYRTVIAAIHLSFTDWSITGNNRYYRPAHHGKQTSARLWGLAIVLTRPPPYKPMASALLAALTKKTLFLREPHKVWKPQGEDRPDGLSSPRTRFYQERSKNPKTFWFGLDLQPDSKRL